MALKHLFKPAVLQYEGKNNLGPNAYIFNFKPIEPLHWQAGQQVLLELQLPSGRRVVESFPILNAPSEKGFKIATRVLPESPDQFKQALLKLKIGGQLKVRGIFGRMIIKKAAKDYAFLTTGIGIAVFRAILKQLITDNLLDTKITLFFVGNKDSHYFKEELTEFKTKLKNLQIEYIYKPDRITGQVLEDTLGKDLSKTTFFIAGSPVLINNYRRLLQGLGVVSKAIKSNHYPFIKHHQHENPAQPKT
jgi:ferredoxin-NADP reductase